MLYLREKYHFNSGERGGCEKVGTGKVLFQSRTGGGKHEFDLVEASYDASPLPEGVTIVTRENVEEMLQQFFHDLAVIDGIMYVENEGDIGRIIGSGGWKIKLFHSLGVKAVKKGYRVSDRAEVVTGKIRKTRKNTIATPGTIVVVTESDYQENGKCRSSTALVSPVENDLKITRKREFSEFESIGFRLQNHMKFIGGEGSQYRTYTDPQIWGRVGEAWVLVRDYEYLEEDDVELLTEELKTWLKEQPR